MTSNLGHFFKEYAATAMNRANGALIHKANSLGQFTVLIHTVVVPYPSDSLGVRPFQDAVPALFQAGGPEQFQRGSPELFQRGGQSCSRGGAAPGAPLLKIGHLIHTPDAAPACVLARGY